MIHRLKWTKNIKRETRGREREREREREERETHTDRDRELMILELSHNESKIDYGCQTL